MMFAVVVVWQILKVLVIFAMVLVTLVGVIPTPAVIVQEKAPLGLDVVAVEAMGKSMNESE